MPKLNRRNFLQIASAAGLAPAIPALSVRAAVATPTAMTSSQMLWASLLSRPGNAASLARTMGISSNTLQGIHAKLIQTHILTAHGAASLGNIARTGTATVKTPTVAKAMKSKPFRFNLKQFLRDDTEDNTDFDEEREAPNTPRPKPTE